MKIIKTDIYKDGGTILLETDEGNYSIDYRIGSETKGKIYKDYPLDDDSNIITNQKEILKKIKEASNKSNIDSYVKNKIDKLK